MKKKCVFFLFGIVYLKKGCMFTVLITKQIINIKTKTIMETNTIQLLLGLIGALSILTFAIIYTNLTTKN